ncbi:MAG: GNAT family N-acetyltransferase [Rhodospirillaceae bacterium]
MVLIRRAHSADAADIAGVFVESWRSTYPGLIPDDYLVGLSVRKSTLRWYTELTQTEEGANGVFVAVDPPRGIVGFGSCGVQRTRFSDFEGEFYTLYLLDGGRGRGLGRRLLAAMAGELVGRGYSSALVRVLRDNQARWFYERMGGEWIGEQTIYLAKTLLPEIAYGWRDLTVLARLPVNPSPG